MQGVAGTPVTGAESRDGELTTGRHRHPHGRHWHRNVTSTGTGFSQRNRRGATRPWERAWPRGRRGAPWRRGAFLSPGVRRGSETGFRLPFTSPVPPRAVVVAPTPPQQGSLPQTHQILGLWTCYDVWRHENGRTCPLLPDKPAREPEPGADSGSICPTVSLGPQHHLPGVPRPTGVSAPSLAPPSRSRCSS